MKASVSRRNKSWKLFRLISICHCEEGEARRGNLFEIIVNSRGWLTGNILLPALRAHYVRPKSLPAILSLRSQ